MKKFNNSQLNAIEIFCAAVKAKNFTEASIVLGTTPSAVSKAIHRIETRLGTKLFQRSTRVMRLTNDGAAYYETCQKALTEIEEIENELTHNSIPRGILRISMPITYGVKYLVPLINQYIDQYQEHIKIEILLSNSISYLTEERIDIAIRLGKIADSRLVSRLLHTSQPKFVASPEYLQRYGTPKHPNDLQQHHCLGLVLPSSGRLLPWLFKQNGEDQEIKINPKIIFDHPLGLLSSTLSGGGITQMLDFSVEDDLQKGHLIELLTSFCPSPQPLYVIYPSNKLVPAKVRTFLDFLYSLKK